MPGGLGSGRLVNSQLLEDIKIARELLYPKNVIKRLENEPDPVKRQRILSNARNGVYK